jgi:hypothetical protein
MTGAFLQQIETAVRSGLSVSAIERKYGFSNRAIRRAKAELYGTGNLPRPTGYEPKDDHAISNR